MRPRSRARVYSVCQCVCVCVCVREREREVSFQSGRDGLVGLGRKKNNSALLSTRIFNRLFPLILCK